MTDTTVSYVEGYEKAIKEMDKCISLSIKSNDGAKTALGVLNVFNDMVTFLHEAMLDVAESKEALKEPLPSATTLPIVENL